MKLIFIYSLVLFIFVGQASARVGETKAQIDARYGPPVESGTYERRGVHVVSETHQFQGFVIRVALVNGVCECETFKHEQTIAQSTSSDSLKRMEVDPLSQKEIEFFLSVNAANAVWKEAQPFTVGWSAWERSDKLIQAYFIPANDDSGGLTIKSAKFAAMIDTPRDGAKGF